MSDAIWVKLCGHGWLVQHGVVSLLGFGGRDIADRSHQAAVIEPVDPLERGELDSLEGSPRPTPMDDLGLVKPVDGLSEGIVVAVANAADGGFDPGFGEPLAVSNADVLRASVGMVHQTTAFDWSALVQGLLEGIEHEARMRRSRYAPANNPSGIGIDDEGHIDEAAPRADIEPVLGLDPRMKSETQSRFGAGAWNWRFT